MVNAFLLQAACSKCGVDTISSRNIPIWLCKLCNEQREVRREVTVIPRFCFGFVFFCLFFFVGVFFVWFSPLLLLGTYYDNYKNYKKGCGATVIIEFIQRSPEIYSSQNFYW